ncbi:hypothetical protein DL766_002121 [Monosporascus sp. MC13-8B]|nr:hypothetical protein DL763_007099 [Monosporascus cannonballus]RYP36234.1 hypothetical protein DL766_002121 [Monosporascus sp. MC13-8B]
MSGPFIPPTFREVRVDPLDMNVVSIICGVSMATAMFTATKACRQTWGVWKRTGGVNGYIVLVWIEWTVNVLMSIVTWFYLWGSISSSFWLFFFLVTLWVLETQCIMQIIINRVWLLMSNKTWWNRVKWGVALIMGLINISVYCIWIPARLQISPTYIHVNEIWDRVEKVIFCLIDASLNLYFIYLVRSRLIVGGLDKYTSLYRFNLVMIGVSMSLDVILIGVMSLGQGIIYVEFHPLVYLLKLHIEMNMAELIVKVARQSENRSRDGRYASANGYSEDSRRTRVATLITSKHSHHQPLPGEIPGEEEERSNKGIHRTIETRVVHHDIGDDETRSGSGGTMELQKVHFHI